MMRVPLINTFLRMLISNSSDHVAASMVIESTLKMKSD